MLTNTKGFFFFYLFLLPFCVDPSCLGDHHGDLFDWTTFLNRETCSDSYNTYVHDMIEICWPSTKSSNRKTDKTNNSYELMRPKRER